MRKPDKSIRIAVTGAGVICSIGCNKAEVWQSIRESRAGIGKLTRFPGETFPTDLAAEVTADLDALMPIDLRHAKRMSRTDRLALIAANEAFNQANEANTPLPLNRAIVSTGTSTGGLLRGEDYYFRRLVRGGRRTPASRVLQPPTGGPSGARASALHFGGRALSNAPPSPSAGPPIRLAPAFPRP